LVSKLRPFELRPLNLRTALFHRRGFAKMFVLLQGAWLAKMFVLPQGAWLAKMFVLL